MTEKVAELLKRALELPSQGRAALTSWLLAGLDEDTADEGAERMEREIAQRVDELKARTLKTIPWLRSEAGRWRGSMGRVAEVEFHPEATAEFDAATE